MLMRKAPVPAGVWRSRAIAVISSFLSDSLIGGSLSSGVNFAAHDPREERIAKSLQRVGRDRLPNTPHQVKVKRDVVDGVVNHGRDFAGDVEVSKVGSRHRPAGQAGAERIEWPRVIGKPGVLDRHLT